MAAVALAALLLPGLVAARASRQLASVSPHAMLVAVPVRPLAAQLRFQAVSFGVWLLFLLPFGVVLLVVMLGLAVFDIFVLNGDGELFYAALVVLAVVASIGVVDAFGMFAGAGDSRGFRRLLAERYPGRSVTVLGGFGAWPRHQDHGGRLLAAVGSELRASPRWDVVVAGAVNDQLAALYASHGLVSISPESGEPPRRILAYEAGSTVHTP